MASVRMEQVDLDGGGGSSADGFFVDLSDPKETALIKRHTGETLARIDSILNPGGGSDGPLGPTADGHFTNAELAKLAAPRDGHSAFAGFEDLSVFTADDSRVPPGRITTGFYKNNEDVWLAEMNRRFSNGDIDQNTLVVAPTGHGPAIAYAMAQRYRSDIYFNYPSDKITEDISRHALQDQG
jgi:hypothetical protein